ncbi:MAG: winged helix-turn-helix transcriptional regulator [Phenylobacterium sp.]
MDPEALLRLSFCPIERTLRVLDSKWTALLLRDLLGGARRFGELLRSLQGVSPKTLTGRLRALEAQGVVRRTLYAEVPPRVEYALTDYGQTLRPVLEAMAVWGIRDAERDAEPAVDLDRKRDAPRENEILCR